ncbi:MAG TPA: adenylate/guanylate cyclase domain-containing protein [Blastocatellia bacterium]|nr:adenylate/guanylate cyclase domain-containing protein [Blastocatellia bacterium]
MDTSAKFYVTDCDTGITTQHELAAGETRIGRAISRNDIVLDDGQVSREHAVVRPAGKTHLIVDLNSANGIYKNGERVQQCVLKGGDIITISKYSLRYEEAVTTLSIRYDNQAMGNTVLLRSVGQIVSSPLPEIDTSSLSNMDLSSQALLEDIVALKKKAETLTRIYDLNEMLRTVFSLEDIFKKISDMLFRLTIADRFFVLLRESPAAPLAPFAAEYRNQGAGVVNEELSMSKTVLDRVLSEKMSLLTFDTMEDERFRMAKSIIMQQVRSVMCAPLLGKDGVLGVMYLDSRQIMQTFTEDDLDLLNALAAVTSIAVDNAITHKQLVREALARAKFGRFMPPFIVDKILANPDEISMGGSNHVVTILFSDIREFTTMAEDLQPEVVVQILNGYFADMTPIIFGHNGLLDKYIGDGLMALFGVPSHIETAAVDAVAAAIDMMRRMKFVNEELKSKGLSEIAIGIGINTGMATVGYIGSEERTDYTAIGDSVNLAARLEKEAQGGQIIISHSTFEAMAGRFPTKPSGEGEVTVKGKSERVRVYEVLWQEAQLTGSGMLLSPSYSARPTRTD